MYKNVRTLNIDKYFTEDDDASSRTEDYHSYNTRSGYSGYEGTVTSLEVYKRATL